MRIPALAVLLAAVGCDPPPTPLPPPDAAPPPTAPPTATGPAVGVGTVVGRVTWAGPRPDVPPLPGGTANPFAPAVDSHTGGLGGAVVSLSGPGLAAVPWDKPPVRVEAGRSGIRVVQGGRPTAVGVARRGDDVTFVSVDPGLRLVRAEGDAFFTLPFPEPGRPLTRRLDRAGRVAVVSGSGHVGHAADVVVSAHRFVAVTAADGSFALNRVPAGDFGLTAELRSWHPTGVDRDPDTGLPCRVRFADPVVKRAAVRVTAGGTARVLVPFAGWEVAAGGRRP